jgi:cyclase
MFWKNSLLSGLLVAVVFAITTAAQQPGGGRQPGSPLALLRVKPGLFMVGGSGGNSVLRVTDAGIVLVDTKLPGEAYYKQLMDLIKVVSDQPVRYAVVTHVHIDHSGNIESFVKNGTQVVAHENLVKNLDTYTPAAAAKPAKPNVTYSRDYSIRLGNTEVAHVYHFASGHTSGDSIVHFPDLGVVAMGDELALPNGVSAYELGGSIPGWAQSLSEVLKLNFDMAIPGHRSEGEPFAPATREHLVELKTKLDSITKNAIELVKKGTPKNRLIAEIQAADANATVGAMLQNNPVRIDLFYEEILRLAK